jgi:hypothetical protein
VQLNSEGKTFTVPMTNDEFIRHIQKIKSTYTKDIWDFVKPPYLDISNVTIKENKLIVYKSTRSTQGTSRFSFSGTIEALITELDGNTILTPSYYLDTDIGQFFKYVFAIGIGLCLMILLIVNPSIGWILLLAFIEVLIFVVAEIIQFENSNNLKLYFSRMLKELLR